ncbi:hypothetical protein [Cellulomonas sp. APG4]|uniref:hypothetical protein n=1 Tax=Cellulomonas sp. APG4 TaxID=1538656 RepID=UPI00192A4C8D|nr:hypothetical protein [Cellulomonas sp. APG4]
MSQPHETSTDAGAAAPDEAAEAAAQAEAEAAEQAEEKAAAQAEAEAAAQAEAEAAAAAAEAEAAAVAAYGEQPALQKEFVAAVVAAQNAARDAANDLQRGAAKAERDQAICALLPAKAVSGWTGKITEIDANGDGKGIFTVEVAEDVEIGTWNNAFSDFQDDTLVEPSSPVFTSGLSLEEGQLVRFSGTLVADSSDGCLRESSLTLRGGLESPSFIFRFSELAGL